MSNLPEKRVLPRVKQIELAEAQGMLKLAFAGSQRGFHPAMLLDGFMYGSLGVFTVDVLKLEKFLSRQGYDPEGGQSIAEFVREKYGDYAVWVVDTLIGNMTGKELKTFQTQGAGRVNEP